MEELEEVEWEGAPLLTRSILSLLCLGAIVMGGAGWLMLLPAIGMMWSRDFLRWRRCSQPPASFCPQSGQHSTA